MPNGAGVLSSSPTFVLDGRQELENPELTFVRHSLDKAVCEIKQDGPALLNLPLTYQGGTVSFFCHISSGG